MPTMAPRPLIYMDHWALSDISRDAGMRARMLPILRRGTLMLSFLNLMETARAKGDTVENIASFLDEIGSHFASITLSSSVVARRERSRLLEPWRDELVPHLLREPRVAGKLSRLIRRLQKAWMLPVLQEWEQQHVAPIIAILEHARRNKRQLKLDGTADVPAVLDVRAVFATVMQRAARRSVKLDRNQIDDLIHTFVPVVHADVVFLDGKTKKLLERMNTGAKVFSKGEIEAAFQYLEGLAAA